MINFRQKNFGKVLNYLKNHPTLPVSTVALGVSSANLAVGSRRNIQAQEIANRQMDLMNRQIDTMSANTRAIKDFINSNKEVSNTFKEGFSKQQQQPKKRKKFLLFSDTKDKNFSIKSSTIAGAQLGFALGAGSSAFFPKKLRTDRSTTKWANPKNPGEKVGGFEVAKEAVPNTKNIKLNDISKGYNNLSSFQRQAAITAVGTIVGAALGALVGIIGEIDKKISHKSINKRLLPEIISNLKKEGLNEGESFTTDPKIADKLRTKVCIVLSRNSGDLRVLINTKSDSKLKRITDEVMKNIPNSSVENKQARNDYNEITITTISDSSADSVLISWIASRFIHDGFPVYIVEVG